MTEASKRNNVNYNKKPLISIILPVYNVAIYLDRCFQSISDQSFTDFEVIAVNDGSTDNSVAVCEKWLNKDSRIKLISQPNGGLSEARNTGIKAALGEYITCIDSDDYVAPSYLEELVKAIKKNPECKMVGCGHYIVRPKGNFLDYSTKEEEVVLSQEDAFESVLYHGIVNVSAWAKLYHKSLFEKCRYPKGHLYEDTYIFGELLLQTSYYIFINRPLYYYCKREDSIVSGSYSSKRLEYIESVKQLIKCAKKCSPDLEKGCIRRLIHANLSVLRYMENCSESDRHIRDNLKNEVFELERKIKKDKKIPFRDKAALFLLHLGYLPFYRGWKLYEVMR